MEKKPLMRLALGILILQGLSFFAASPTQASLLSDSFVGLSRSALQDASPTWDNSDPFQSLGNPAWFSRKSKLSALYSLTSASLGESAQSEKSSQLLILSVLKSYEFLSLGAVAFMPASGQPILDTGNSEVRSSPWMNMNRQLLYAGHLSYRAQGSNFSLGVLLPLYFDAEARAVTRLETSDISSRAQVSLKPRLSYGLGLSYENLWARGWGLSAFYKERSRSRAQASIEGNIPILSLDLLFEGESYYSFDPRRLSFNVFRRHDQGIFGLRLRYSNWVEYQTPYIRVTDSSLVLNDRVPAGRSKNTWDMALSWDQALDAHSSIAASVGYRPTPFDQVSTFFDADHYLLGLGYRKNIFSDWDIATSLRLHILASGDIYTWASLGVGYAL